MWSIDDHSLIKLSFHLFIVTGFEVIRGFFPILDHSMKTIFTSAAVMMMLLNSYCFAADTEERTFNVILEGKVIGKAAMKFEMADQSTQQFSMTVDAKGKVSFVSFHYQHRSTERWKDGMLQSIESHTNDDGKKTKLTGQRTDTLKISANSKERKIQGDVITTSGWRQFLQLKNGVKLNTLDTEDGSETLATVKDLGADQFNFNGKSIAVQKFKLTGRELDAEWWFDANGRPVKQVLVWDGHKVTLELSAIH